jgi:hypothetical protein
VPRPVHTGPPAPPPARDRVRALPVLLAFAVSSIPFTLPALAYVDPAASSLLLQLILGGLAGLGVLLRLLWGRIRRTWRREPQPGADEKPGSGPSR